MPAGAGQHISALWMANLLFEHDRSEPRNPYLRIVPRNRALALAAGERRLDVREGAADPRAFVLGRLQATRPHQPVGVGIPGTVRELLADPPSPAPPPPPPPHPHPRPP